MTLATARSTIATQDTDSADPARRAVVERARESWVQRLVDRSRRNMLLYFRPLKTGMLDLTDAQPGALNDLMRGESVSVSRLLPQRDEAVMAGNIQAIRRRAQENAEEKGIETLFLAVGMASWPAIDGGRPPESPILLMPLEIEIRGREGRSFALKRKGDVQLNLVLLQALEAEFGRVIAPEAIVNGNGSSDEPFNPDEAFEHLRGEARGIKDFSVVSRAVLGNFSFQKMAMVRDLLECSDALVGHDLVAALAGDPSARGALLHSRTSVDAHDLDRNDPGQEFLVVDADSSQQRVVASVLGDQDGVIHGPPGTGKSQTIVNIIAELAANGRRTLFVAEKRAALEVVLRRLTDVGLGHLALDLHGADISRRDIIRRIADSLDLVRDALPVDGADLHQRFVERRDKLNQHARRLHTARGTSNLSVFEIQGRLLELGPRIGSTTRWRGTALRKLSDKASREIEVLLTEASGFETLILGTSQSPWARAKVTDVATAEAMVELAAELGNELWPALRESSSGLVEATGLVEPHDLEDLERLLVLVEDVERTLACYAADLFSDPDLDLLAEALGAGVNGGFAALWSFCTSKGYRSARTRGLAYRLPARGAHSIASDLSAAARQRTQWRERSDANAIPHATGKLAAEARRKLASFAAKYDDLRARMANSTRHENTLTDLDALVAQLAGDSLTPRRLARLAHIERTLESHGLAPLLNEIRTRSVPASDWLKTFRHARLSSLLDAAYGEDSALAAFDGKTHQQFVDEFRSLDRERLHVAVQRVRRAHAERVIAAMNAHPEQEDLVRREAAKRARHLPLRKLLAQAPDVLTALFPCWMASPLAVSQLIGADRRYFDVVLFDEASQVLPEDAAAALLRGRRAVVAGDRHQLPPTTFFAGGDDELQDVENEPAPSEGFESLLDMMAALIEPWPLDWHYRSKDERLIAFANRHVYGDRLVTFPSAHEASAVQHHLVDGVLGVDGQEDSPSAEVARVVELVFEHARTYPGESLGVITLGIKHANRLQAAIDRARIQLPELDDFFDEHSPERFFVKNLERVQGDERDAIILSLGVGKMRHAAVDYRGFGPLNGEGGERRLNVAITRARRRMAVVSSFTHLDMDPERSRAGTGMLRDYLQYAASGGTVFGDGRMSSVPLNPFEADIADTLTGAGIPLIAQWGASKYRIDFVARHPERPGHFVLAIECDGASYHAAPTARDRDRLRQQHLESLGWRFHRIWSTDWFLHREDEIQRAKDAYRAAVAIADGDSVVKEIAADACTPMAQINPTAAPTESRRGRPRIVPRQQIDTYSTSELRGLVDWITADGRLRTNDEIVDDMVEALGYARRGTRIMQRLQQVVSVHRG